MPLAVKELVMTGAGCTPVPVKGTTRMMEVVWTETVASFAPTVAGLKTTVMVQVEPSCGRLGLPTVQVPPVIVKSAGLVPPGVIASSYARPDPVTAPT